jgi:hypothetical protein
VEVVAVASPQRRNTHIPVGAELRVATPGVVGQQVGRVVKQLPGDAYAVQFNPRTRHQATRRGRNPVEPGDDVTAPYPFERKSERYSGLDNRELLDGIRQAVASRDGAEGSWRSAEERRSRSAPAFKAAERELRAAEREVARAYAISGWHTDDVHTLAQERASRGKHHRGALSELAANPGHAHGRAFVVIDTRTGKRVAGPFKRRKGDAYHAQHADEVLAGMGGETATGYQVMDAAYHAPSAHLATPGRSRSTGRSTAQRAAASPRQNGEMTAERAREIVRRMRDRGTITSGEYSDALRDIAAGRGDAAVRFLRGQQRATNPSRKSDQKAARKAQTAARIASGSPWVKAEPYITLDGATWSFQAEAGSEGVMQAESAHQRKLGRKVRIVQRGPFVGDWFGRPRQYSTWAVYVR